MPEAKQTSPWRPDQCPVTGRKFFMWVRHWERGVVPTYGGPYDSFTLAERDEHGTFWCERYDHDEGVWSDSIHIDLRLIDNQRDDCDHGQIEELQAALQVAKDRSRTITLSGCEFTEEELIGRAVRCVSGTSRYKTAHWALMKDAFGCGSGVATALCRRFGLDPDEELRK